MLLLITSRFTSKPAGTFFRTKFPMAKHPPYCQLHLVLDNDNFYKPIRSGNLVMLTL